MSTSNPNALICLSAGIKVLSMKGNALKILFFTFFLYTLLIDTYVPMMKCGTCLAGTDAL